jgi:hypothetical protein
MTNQEAINKLESMEKAMRNLEKIDINSETAPYGFYRKRRNSYKKIYKEHHNFLRSLWDKGIFL